jgi:prephenate dehydrogenase
LKLLEKVGIAGLGLIGGSLARALRARGLCRDIHAFDTDGEALEAALREGVVTSFSSEIDDGFSGCEAVFVCVPSDKIAACAAEIFRFCGADCLLTDVGSVKAEICSEIWSAGIPFIGGHPMTGLEKTGFSAAKEFLFENSYYILTPPPGADEAVVARLSGVVRGIGAVPLVLTPEAHDEAVAAVSHAPHVAAAALVNAALGAEGGGARKNTELRALLAAGGFRDITRVASGSPVMWRAICEKNPREIKNALLRLRGEIDGFLDKLARRDFDGIYTFFDEAKTRRDGIERKKSGAYPVFGLFADISDRPGAIAAVAELLYKSGVNIKNIGIINSREFENGVMKIELESARGAEKAAEALKNGGYTVYSM